MYIMFLRLMRNACISLNILRPCEPLQVEWQPFKTPCFLAEQYKLRLIFQSPMTFGRLVYSFPSLGWKHGANGNPDSRRQPNWIRLGEKWQSISNESWMQNYWLVVPPPTRRTAIGGYPRVASYDMLGEQLHSSNPAKHDYATCWRRKDSGIPLRVLPKDTTSKLAGLFSTLSFFMLSTKQESFEYHFLKYFGMTRLEKWIPDLPTAKRTLYPLRHFWGVGQEIVARSVNNIGGSITLNTMLRFDYQSHLLLESFIYAG